MCGIAGIIRQSGVQEVEINKMIDCLVHRGPDDQGIWISDDRQVGLGHARLAIIDLSPGGHQPMQTPDKRYTITFNGEIYNYEELKKELEGLGHSFSSTSDTEVLLASYVRWGRGCLDKLRGMFAFAIWDSQEKKLFAARDRLGQKPFLYATQGDQFVFASELKAFSGMPGQIDWSAVDVALSLRFVPSPQTGIVGIEKLPAGHSLEWKDGAVTIQRYWSPQKSGGMGVQPTKEEIWELFLEAVQDRLVSDVPIGAFLSGGMDSSAVVVAMKALGVSQPKTFVMSYDDKSEDKRYARLVADHLGTEHHEISLGDLGGVELLEKMAVAYDEPFFDQSGMLTLLISEAMKQEVSVVLSGDGADELFGGYRAYQYAMKRDALAPGASAAARLAARLPFLPLQRRYQAEVLSLKKIESYLSVVSTWQEALPITQRYLTKETLYEEPDAHFLHHTAEHLLGWAAGSHKKTFVDRMMYADVVGRLADGYLQKVDIGSMAHALEVRSPFLDHRLVEAAQRLPLTDKIRHGQGKYLWREILKEKLPREIFERPKQGFSFPLGDYLMSEDVKPFVEDILLSGTSRIASRYNKTTLTQLWYDQVRNKADYSNHILSLVLLELWLKKMEQQFES